MAAIDVEELERARRERIEFSLPKDEKPPSILEIEREKHRQRASKFGGEYIEPSRVKRELALEARKERFAREGFATGIDIFSQEETAKRNSRASRFNIPEPQGPKYAPDQDELAKAARAKKFGVQGYEPAASAMMDMDLFEERQEVAKDVERRPNAIYLYGVDVMSTKDCLQYFGDYGPTFIEWINDSSCAVVFRDEHSARRAMAGVGRPLPSEEMAGESSAGLDPFDPANMPYFWHKGRDFIKEGTPVHLIYRMATVEDKKDMRAPRKTRELWKQPHQQQGGARKARRTGTQQQQQRERVDGDGDVAMGDAEVDDANGDGKRQRNRKGGRRRKQRNADGTQSVVQEDGGDVVMNDEEAMGEGLGSEHRRQPGPKDRKQAANYQLWGSRPAHEHGQQQQQQQQQQQPVEHSSGQVDDEDGAQGQSPGNVEALLRRIVHARRASKKGKAGDVGAGGTGVAWPSAVQPEQQQQQQVLGSEQAADGRSIEPEGASALQ